MVAAIALYDLSVPVSNDKCKTTLGTELCSFIALVQSRLGQGRNALNIIVESDLKMENFP